MAFTKISVLVPTRKRVDRLQKMIRSFELTTSGRSELVFRIDQDDTETKEILKGIPWRLKRAVYEGPRHEGYRSTPQFLQDMLPLAHGDVLMVGNDDMLFDTLAWDKEILDVANQYPDGLFNIGVETLNADHYPFSIVSRQLVDTLGHLYDPRIFWGDIYLRDILAAFGRAILLPEVRILHDWAGFKPDMTFAESASLKTSIGTPEYWQTHSACVNEAVQRLRGVTV